MDNELKQFLKDHVDLIESENTTELLLECPCNLLHRLCRFLVLCGVDPEDLKPYYTYIPLPNSLEKYVHYVLNTLKDYLSLNFNIELTIGKSGVRRLTNKTIAQYWSLNDIKNELIDHFNNNELPTDDTTCEDFVDILDQIPCDEFILGVNPFQSRSKMDQFRQEMDTRYGIE